MSRRKIRRSAKTTAPPEGGALRQAAPVDVGVLGLGFTVLFHLLFHRYFPTELGRLGHDHSYFLPHLLAGDYWAHENGPLAVAWFTPAFCGGMPMFANPQSPFYTVAQWLSITFFDPLTSVYVTMLGFAWLGYAGFYLLARGSFGASRPAALLGAVLFMFNGLFTHRMIIGHFTFHAFMLMPLLAYLLLRRPTDWTRDVALAALPIAYMVMSGMIQLILPTLLAVAVVGIAHRMFRGGRLGFWTRFVAAVALAGAMCLARLSASGAFLAPFPRDDYKLPGAASVVGVLELLLESLFVRPAHRTAAGVVVNQQWILEQHEFEFGVTIVPLLLLLVAGASAIVRWRRTGLGRPSPRAVAEGVIAAIVMTVPIAINYYSPSWNEMLKSLPLIGSSSSLFRWFSLYIPLVILAAARALDEITSREAVRWVVAGAGIAVCLTANLLADDGFYRQQPYDPRAIEAAYAAIGSRIPAIETIGDATMMGDDHLVRGTSPALCYEPIFGYRLEHLPFGTLEPGPALAEHDGILNVKNPACYVFPVENHCAPGDHFPASRRADAAAFLRYRPYPFAMPVRQRVYDVVSALAFAATIALLLVGPARRLAGRGASTA